MLNNMFEFLQISHIDAMSFSFWNFTIPKLRHDNHHTSTSATDFFHKKHPPAACACINSYQKALVATN